MQSTIKELLDLMQLEPRGKNIYRGKSQDLGWGRVYGGQVLGQAVMAVSSSVEGRPIHSLHAYFLRFGDCNHHIDYDVERLRDGGAFSIRRVVAHQLGQPIFVLSASFQALEEGLEHQATMPDVPPPEDLSSDRDLRMKLVEMYPDLLSQENFCKEWPIDVRHVDPVDPSNPKAKPPVNHVWIRTIGPVPDDPVMQRGLLAYASDWGLLGTSLHPHQLAVFSPTMQVASLDHALWFHRDFRIDEWLLYAQDSPSASFGRGFNRGNIFTRDGKLVASVCQEGLIRNLAGIDRT